MQVGKQIAMEHTSGAICGVVIADDRRARQWERGLLRVGLRARLQATRGSDAEKGEYWVMVPRSQERAAQHYVSKVLAGQSELPRVAVVRGPLLWGAFVIVFLLAALLVATMFQL